MLEGRDVRAYDLGCVAHPAVQERAGTDVGEIILLALSQRKAQQGWDLRLGGESSADTTRLLSSPFRNPGEARELLVKPTGPLIAVCL